MVKIKMDKAPKPTLTSAHVYEAHKLKRLAGEEKLLSPADLVTHAMADAVHQMPKKQGAKDKEDEKLAMEIKGVKDAEKKPRKPRAKKAKEEHKEEVAAHAGDEAEKKPRKPRAKKAKEEHKEEVISHAVEEHKVVQAAAEKAAKAIRKGRFEKGSQEAKDYMARMRAMRKKKE